MSTDERSIKQEAINNLRNQAESTLDIDYKKLLLDSADRLEREINQMSKLNKLVEYKHNPIIW
jgi:hypothetical protein